MTFDPNNHEHDEDGDCLDDEGNVFDWHATPPQPEQPNYEWSFWDLAGVTATTVGGVFMIFNQGLNLLAREFYAAGQWSRGQKEKARNRTLIADDIRSLERGGGDG